MVELHWRARPHIHAVAAAAEPEITIIGSQACKQAKAAAGRQAEREFDTVISHTWWFEWGKVASKKISKIRHELFSTFNHNARAMLCARDLRCVTEVN